MTRSTAEFTETLLDSWNDYSHWQGSPYRAFLYRQWDADDWQGCGWLDVARLNSGPPRLYATVVVQPESRRQGLGRAIFGHLANLAPEVWAEIRADNLACRRTVEKAGYELAEHGRARYGPVVRYVSGQRQCG